MLIEFNECLVAKINEHSNVATFVYALISIVLMLLGCQYNKWVLTKHVLTAQKNVCHIDIVHYLVIKLITITTILLYLQEQICIMAKL